MNKLRKWTFGFEEVLIKVEDLVFLRNIEINAWGNTRRFTLARANKKLLGWF